MKYLFYCIRKFFQIISIAFQNTNNLEKPTNKVKQIIHAEETYNSDYVMTCINKIPSAPNALNKLLLHKSLHYSYIQTEFNEK